VIEVVEAEGPIHRDELASRVAGMWGNKAGSNISRKILAASRRCEDTERIGHRGDFLWPRAGVVQVRDRSGVNMSAESICPEEYQAAVRLVLEGGRCLPRERLVTEVREILGYARTGRFLEAAIRGAIDLLLAAGALGEASAGIRVRPGPEPV
jgi:hypothetical protein